MKKLFLLTALTALIFAVSCSKDDTATKGAEEATATLTVKLPEDIVTRAFGDGKLQAKNLIIGVFDENGVEKFRKNYVWDVNVFEDEVEITFFIGNKYQLVFWAQYGEAYGKPENMKLDKISLDYKVSNREDLDAFYAFVPVFTVTKDFGMTVEMKRPFAQLNWATTVGDMDEAINAGLLNKATVTVKNAANTLDLFTGKTYYADENGTTNPKGAEIVIPATEFPKDANGKYHTIEIYDTEYEIIAMNYVLVADDGATDGKTTVELKLNVGEVNLNVQNANMKRNYKTNIYGELLTGEGTFKVKVNPFFDDEENTNWTGNN